MTYGLALYSTPIPGRNEIHVVRLTHPPRTVCRAEGNWPPELLWPAFLYLIIEGESTCAECRRLALKLDLPPFALHSPSHLRLAR